MKKISRLKIIFFLYCSYILVLNCAFMDLLAAKETVSQINGQVRGCTSFCLNYLNDSSCIFGTNFDFPYSAGQVFVNKRNVIKAGWETGTTGRRAQWTSKYGSLTFNLGGYQLVWAGMNEAGLVVSSMLLPKTKPAVPDQRPPLASAFWLQF